MIDSPIFALLGAILVEKGGAVSMKPTIRAKVGKCWPKASSGIPSIFMVCLWAGAYMR